MENYIIRKQKAKKRDEDFFAFFSLNFIKEFSEARIQIEF
jgi:hypothetical protein